MTSNVLIICFVLFNFLFSQFDWIEGGVPIRQGDHIEWQRTTDMSSSGNVILAWSDTRTGDRDVYVQKVDALGNVLWGEDGIAVVKNYGRQEDPLLISDDQGGAFVIWIDYRDEPDTKGDIYVQHILSDGSLHWPLGGQVIVDKEGAQRSPNMCSDGQGGVYIIWRDLSEGGAGDKVYATHISADNEIINPGEGVPIITNNSAHASISLETAGNGQAAMAWIDDRNDGPDGTGTDIYGQRISADHENNTITTLWSTVEEGGVAICDAQGNQSSTKITYAYNDITVVTWQDARDGNFDIYMQYLLGNGDPYFTTSPQGLALTTLASSQTKPRVKADESGAYIIWYSNADLYAQKVIMSQDSPVVWDSEGIAICNANSEQTGARLTTDNQGGVYIAWEDARSEDSSDVYLQHINSNNQISFDANGLVVSNANLNQQGAVVRADDTGNVFIFWEDRRVGSPGIYVQNIDSSGNLNIIENGVEIYYGVDGVTTNINSERLDNGQVLVYWEDGQGGSQSSINLAKIIDSDYGLSYESAIMVENKTLSENTAQTFPSVKKVGDQLFFGFLRDNILAQADPYEGYAQYFQMSTLPDLSLIGDPNGTWLNPSNSYQYDYIAEGSRSVELVVNDNNEIFYFTSLSEFYAGLDIYVRKVDANGSVLWDTPKNLTFNFDTDAFVRAAFKTQSDGVFIVYQETASELKDIYITAIDQDGNILDGFPKEVSNLDNQQSFEHAVDTGSGVFIVWKENRTGVEDVYGQYFDYNGNPLTSVDEIEIAISNYQKGQSMIAANQILNEVLVCYEEFNTTDFDIFCNSIDLDNFQINQTYNIANQAGDQIDPYVYPSLNGHYMIVWEDSRSDDGTNLQIHTDIYYQEINQEGIIYQQGGIAVCNSYHIQTSPKIEMYKFDDNSSSYIIYWSDLRSTGKDLLYNVYAQSITQGLDLKVDYKIENEFNLHSIYPNPFNPKVNISLSNNNYDKFLINIYDLNGRLIETVYNDYLDYGHHTFSWDASNYSSGIYMVSLQSNESKVISKISLLK